MNVLNKHFVTLVDDIAPPPPIYKQRFCSSQTTLLCMGEGAQKHFYIAGLIIFVKDCRCMGSHSRNYIDIVHFVIAS